VDRDLRARREWLGRLIRWRVEAIDLSGLAWAPGWAPASGAWHKRLYNAFRQRVVSLGDLRIGESGVPTTNNQQPPLPGGVLVRGVKYPG
jgi:hypothetical protein